MLYSPAFAALFLANFATVSSFAAFFLFPLFISEHGGSQEDIGLIMGTFALASALCRPWVSDMIDRVGRKRSYTLGCLVMAAMPLAYVPLAGPLEDFYLPLMLLRIFHGIGLAICFTAVFTFIADLIPTDRLNEGIGIFGISGLLGMAAGPALAELILMHQGFKTYFYFSSALAIVALVAHLPLRDDFSPPPAHRQTSFFALLAHRKHLAIALLAMTFGIGVAATGNFVTPLGTQRGISFISRFYIAYSLAAVAIRFVGGPLADRLGEYRLLPYALFISASGLFLLALAQTGVILTAAGALAGCGHGLLFPTLNALAIRNEPAPIRGKITGIFTGGIDAGGFAGSLLLGHVAETWGLSSLFVSAGGAMLCGLLIRRLWSPLPPSSRRAP